MCLFTISKCIKIGQPNQEKSGLSKIKVTVNHPVGHMAHVVVRMLQAS